MGTPETGILLVGHGTVQSLDEIPNFLLRIRRGRPPTESLISEMRERYAAIGGSPLLKISQAQAGALEAATGMPTVVAMRFGAPDIRATLRASADRGLKRLVVLPLAPFSVHVYAGAVEAAATELAEELGDRLPECLPVNAWGLEQPFVDAHVRHLNVALGKDPDRAVVLSAHSLPLRVLEMGDPYAEQVTATAKAISDALDRPVHLCYQSQGEDLGAWLGPDLRGTLAEVAAANRRVVLSPVGFLADHVETLYDLDIEAQGWAKELGVEVERLAALNTDPGLIQAMAKVAERALAG